MGCRNNEEDIASKTNSVARMRTKKLSKGREIDTYESLNAKDIKKEKDIMRC